MVVESWVFGGVCWSEVVVLVVVGVVISYWVYCNNFVWVVGVGDCEFVEMFIVVGWVDDNDVGVLELFDYLYEGIVLSGFFDWFVKV